METKMMSQKEFTGELLGTFGWGSAAFPDNNGGFFFVYILGPVLGGALAALFFQFVLEPLMKNTSEGCDYNN
jgi:hypothetical protein